MRKYISATGAVIGAGSAISKDDLIFILSLVITIINLVIGYLETRKKKGE